MRKEMGEKFKFKLHKVFQGDLEMVLSPTLPQVEPSWRWRPQRICIALPWEPVTNEAPGRAALQP